MVHSSAQAEVVGSQAVACIVAAVACAALAVALRVQTLDSENLENAR